MPRNLNRRVELLFPVLDDSLRRRIRDEILGTYLWDNVKARRMQPDGSYQRVNRRKGDHAYSSQDVLLSPGGANGKRPKLVW